MMLIRAKDNNIQSFAYTWLHKGNQNEFLKHSKIKWLDGGHKLLIFRCLRNSFCFLYEARSTQNFEYSGVRNNIIIEL